VPNWFKPGFDRWGQRFVAVAIDNPNRIFIGAMDSIPADAPLLAADGTLMKERAPAELPPPEKRPHANLIMVVNANGEVIENWSQWDADMGMPHHIYFNPYEAERNVWVVDRSQHQIHKFSNDGKKMLKTIGEK